MAPVRSTDVSPQRSFYRAGFIFPGLTSLGGWALACAVGGVFEVGSDSRRGSSGSLVVVVVVVIFFHDDVSPQRSFYWAGFIFPGLTSLGGWASACAVAVYSESDRRGSSGSLVVVVVVTFFHDDVSQRSFYWAGFIFPCLTSLDGPQHVLWRCIRSRIGGVRVVPWWW